jgi:hypothetical protein
MTLSAAVTRHHTAWVHCPACRPHPVRYAVDGDRLIWFADRTHSPSGRSVFATVHEIAGGPAVAEMSGRLREVAADDVDPNAVIDLLEHVSLGRTADEVAASLAGHRARPIVAFEPSAP